MANLRYQLSWWYEITLFYSPINAALQELTPLTKEGFEVFGFGAIFLDQVFSFCAEKLGFWFWSLYQFADFRFFGSKFSVSEKNTHGFSDLISNTVFLEW